MTPLDLLYVLIPWTAGVAIRRQRVQSRELAGERARVAVAEERARIARELHDEVAHSVSVIAVQADAAEGALAHDAALVREPLVAIRETARGTLSEMRRVLGSLRDEDAELTPAPGLDRLDELVAQTRAAGLSVDLRVEGTPVRLPSALDLAAYRVVQEGLTNVRKHAGASGVEVIVRYGRDRLELEVLDDGDGSGAGSGTGRGLTGIRERVALFGGELAAGRRERGFALRVDLPLA